MGNLQTKITRSEAYVKKTRPYAHDCNECEACQGSIKNNNNNYCSACQFIFFEKLYKDFSSGNKEVDEIIKNPIYIPLKDFNGKLNYYDWIPWERLSNVNEIARGGFGIIYKATWIDGRIDTWSIGCNGEYKREGTVEVAIKIIKTNSEEVFKELNIQRTMFINKGRGVDYICSMYGITQNAETLEYGIVMDFAKRGDMRNYLSTNFHSTSWIDLHSGNILQLYERLVRIGDFGLCQPVNHEATTITTTTTTTTTTTRRRKDTKEKKIYGVIPYIPPEVLRGEKFTKAGDIYSYGMLLWELATGKPPFYDCKHDHILIMAILNGQRPKITFPLIPPRIAEIIITCWDPNPENRPTAEEIDEMLFELKAMYEWFIDKSSTDEESTAEGFIDAESTDEEFSYKESKTVSLQFLESEKYLKEMAESDDSTTTNQSTTTMTTTTTRIHSGAVYTSRVLTLQMIDFSKDLIAIRDLHRKKV
ncbi:hypothetical protein G9A89_004425 [Geosiphon pyriformis]|nr:hypothetical protein G9A89_004425 [Geosiphon pyriformis]